MHAVVVGALLSLCLWAYYEHVVEHFESSISLNLIGAPIILGILCYVLLPKAESKWIALMILPFVVPILPLAILEGDPSYPGLEWVLFGPIAFSMLIGELVAWGINIVRIRLKKGGNAQA